MRLLPLFVFWCLWLLNFSTRTIFSPILPLIEDNLSISHGAAGGLFISLSIGFSITLIITGRFASNWGYKRMVVIGFIWIGLAIFALRWAESYMTFHLLFFLLGVGSGTYLPSVLPIITETYDLKHWGRAIGFHDSAASVSIFTIPILVPIGLHYLPWKNLLLILGIVPLLLLIPFWKLSVEPKHESASREGLYMDLLKNRTVWIMGLLWIFSAASSLGVYSILPLYLIKERGMDFGFANTLLGVSRAAGVVVPLTIGLLTDRYGFRVILKWGIFATGLSTIGIALSPNLLSILVTLVFQALLSLAFFPVAYMAISILTPLSGRAMTIGFVTAIGVIFGTGGSPFVLGLVADHLNFRVGLFGLGVLTAFSSLMVRFLEDRRERPGNG
jgi:MFS family permease